MDPNTNDRIFMASGSQIPSKENPHGVSSPVKSNLQTAWTPINQYNSFSSQKLPLGSNQKAWKETNWNPPVANSRRPSSPLSPRSKQRTPLPSSAPKPQTSDNEAKKGKAPLADFPQGLSHKRQLSSPSSPSKDKRLKLWEGQDYSILASASNSEVQVNPMQSLQSGRQLEHHFHCPTCEMSFSSQPQVTTHINTVCSTPHTCKKCNRNFCNRRCVNRHEAKCHII